MKIFICNVCGHVEFSQAPEKCPVCGAIKFTENDNIFKESAEKSKEASVKHIPDIKVNKECGMIQESTCVDLLVRIGKTLHPMEEKHLIKFIDCYVDGKYVQRVLLTPGVNPATVIHLKAQGSNASIVENCNIHGYWMSEVSLLN